MEGTLTGSSVPPASLMQQVTIQHHMSGGGDPLLAPLRSEETRYGQPRYGGVPSRNFVTRGVSNHSLHATLAGA